MSNMFIGAGLYEFRWTYNHKASGEQYVNTEKKYLDKPEELNYHYNSLHKEFAPPEFEGFRLSIRYIDRS